MGLCVREKDMGFVARQSIISYMWLLYQKVQMKGIFVIAGNPI